MPSKLRAKGLTLVDGSYAVDTNIVIALFAGDKKLADRLDAAKRVCVPVVVLGELLYGAKNSSNPKANTQKIEEFMAECEILITDKATTYNKYADIKNEMCLVFPPL